MPKSSEDVMVSYTVSTQLEFLGITIKAMYSKQY